MSFRLVRASAAGGVAMLGVCTVGALALAGVAPTTARAQVGGARVTETGQIRGRVVEAGSQRPIGDAQVSVVGTTLGAITNAAGEYTISRAPAGATTLRVRRIGFGAATQQVAVPAGGEVRAEFTLSPAAAQLDQVVVTGTGTETTRRTLGNAITQLDVADITQRTTVSNVTDLLQSRSPGVTLVPGSGTAGTAADIRIRGTSSLGGTNRPIFFIDGVRFYDGGAGNFGPSGAGNGTFAQGVSALDALNPEDIESVEVIKGPAAATLYGADAAGGVIQIITKKGSRQQARVNWNAKAEGGANSWGVEDMINYTTCTQARADSTVASGTDRGKPLYPDCQGRVGQVISGNPLKDDPNGLRTGQYRNLLLSARGGAERYTFYTSGDFSFDEGVLRNNSNERTGARANFSYAPSQKLDFSINSGYVKQRLRLPLGDDAGGGLLISAVRGKPGKAVYNGLGATNTRGWAINLPEVANEYNNRLDSDRFTTGLTANWRPLTWFRNRFTTGLDYYSPLATIYYSPGTLFSSGDFPSGYFAQRTPQTRYVTFDYAGTLSNTLTPRFTSEFTVGAQGIKSRTRTLTATGSGLPSGDFKTIQAATTISASSDYSSQASLGYYAQEQVGYANRLFLTAALRMDNNSAFGSKINRITYPKYSLSYVLSEEPALSGVFRALHSDNFKVRLAYGQAGRAPAPFVADRTYGAAKTVNGDQTAVTALTQGAPGNENLKPERGTETEGGFDAGFFGGRASIEFTGYKKKTTDALVNISNAPSTGFTAGHWVNFGAIQNSGIELGVRVTPVQTRVATWDASLNFSTNHNLMLQLKQPGIDQFIPYNPYAPTAYPSQLILEGKPVAAFWAIDAVRNPDGTPKLNATGTAVLVDTLQSPLHYVGPALPTHEGSFSNQVTLFGNLRLSALVDFKGGNYLFNQKSRNREGSLYRNDKRFNDPSHPLTLADSLYYSNSTITAPWIQPADFVKLRDLSVAYTLPKALLSVSRVQNLTVMVAAHNVAILSTKYDGLDPEVNFFGQGALNYTGLTNFVGFIRTDSYTLPMTRRLTASISANF